jgi:hypothetical protein
MFEAVGCPGHRLQALFFDRLAIDQTGAEGAGFDAIQRVTNQIERGRIGLGAGELFIFQLVGDAVVPDITWLQSAPAPAPSPRFRYSTIFPDDPRYRSSQLKISRTT